MERHIITHYIPREVDPNGWIQISFLTKKEGQRDDSYMVGFQKTYTLSKQQVDNAEKNGHIICMPHHPIITTEKRLWLTPKKDLVIAAADDPVYDHSQHHIFTMQHEVSDDSINSDKQHKLFDELYESDFVKKLLHKKTLTVFKGDYFLSVEKKKTTEKNPSYYPRWQDAMVQKIIDHFEKKVPNTKITCDFRPWTEHALWTVRDLIQNKKDLVLEFIFLTNRRKEYLSLVHLGNISSLAILFHKNSAFKRTSFMVQYKSKMIQDSPEKWLPELIKTNFSICVHQNTAAGDFLKELILTLNISEKNISGAEYISGLTRWIEGETDRVILCDIGIAIQVEQLLNEKSVPVSWETLSYGKPIQIGLAYDAKDKNWGDFLHKIFNEVWRDNSNDDSIEKSFNETDELMEKLGGQWIYETGTRSNVIKLKNRIGA